MKRNRVALSTFVTALTLLWGFGLAQESDADLIKEVRKVDQQYRDAVNQQDEEVFRQLWTEDGQELFPNGPTVTGIDALVEYYAFSPENVGTFKFSDKIATTEVSGDLAYSQGTYRIVDAEGQILDEGKWISIYKRVDGEWKKHRLISNSNLPASEATLPEGTGAGEDTTSGEGD